MESDLFDGMYAAERSWSLLDPKPVVAYHSKYDEYFVFWNGAVMPYAFGLCLASERFGVYASPAMKEAMHATVTRLFYAGAFGSTNKWQSLIKDKQIYSYLKVHLKEHLDKICTDKVTAHTITEWFYMNNARII